MTRCSTPATRWRSGSSAWSRPGIELTKRSLWASLDAASLSQHMNQEGVQQLFVRMMTDNFEEATRARREKRAPVFRDTRG